MSSRQEFRKRIPNKFICYQQEIRKRIANRVKTLIERSSLERSSNKVITEFNQQEIRKRIANKVITEFNEQQLLLYPELATCDLTDLEVVRKEFRIRRYKRYYELNRFEEIYGDHFVIQMFELQNGISTSDMYINSFRKFIQDIGEEIEYLRTLKASLIRDSNTRSILDKIKPAILNDE